MHEGPTAKICKHTVTGQSDLKEPQGASAQVPIKGLSRGAQLNVRKKHMDMLEATVADDGGLRAGYLTSDNPQDEG